MPSRAKSHRGQIEDKEAERDNEELIEAMNSKLLLSNDVKCVRKIDSNYHGFAIGQRVSPMIKQVQAQFWLDLLSWHVNFP